MLYNLELGVFAFGNDVIKVESSVGLKARHVLHDRIIGTDGICGDNINIGKCAGDADCFTTANKLLFRLLIELCSYGGH